MFALFTHCLLSTKGVQIVHYEKWDSSYLHSLGMWSGAGKHASRSCVYKKQKENCPLQKDV